MERDPLVRGFLVLLIVAVSLHLASALWSLAVQFGDIILLFFLAWLIAFTLTPVAQRLVHLRRMPWPAAVALVYFGLLLVLVAATVLALPVTVYQIDQLSRSMPVYLEQLPAWTASAEDWLRAHRLSTDLSSFYRLENLAQRADTIGTALAQNALGVVQGIATTVVEAILVLILSVYMALDGDRLTRQLVRLLPANYQSDVDFFFQCIDRTFGGFIRGTIVQAVIYGVGTALIMWVFGLSYVLPISLFAGMVMVIPFVGTFLAIVPPLIVAVFAGSVTKLVLAAIVLLVLQQIVLNVVVPKMMSQAVGIHPLVVFLSMLVGVKVAGIWGAIFGVPVAGVLNAMAVFLYERTLRSRSVAEVGAPTQVS